MNRLNSTLRIAFTAAVAAGFALPHLAMAQGRGEDKKIEKAEVKADKKIDKAEIKADKKGEAQAKKHVTTLQGVSVTRDVLLANGYQVVNVVPSGTSQVIYYRRGNMGQGRGLGPVQKIVVVPAGQVVQFQSVPQSLLSTILSRLGM
jgi:hypothetical protein